MLEQDGNTAAEDSAAGGGQGQLPGTPLPRTLELVEAQAKIGRIGKLVLPIFILAALALRLPGLNGDLVDHDSWRQTDTATIARNFLEEPRLFWPRIDWGAPGPGYVETELQLYPFVVSLIYRVAGEDPLWGRLLSLLLTGLSCLVLLRLARRFLPEWGAILVVILFVLAPLNFRFSRAFMPEATVLLFYLLTLERFLAYLEEERWPPLLASAVAMALAFLVKPTSIHIFPVLLLLATTHKGLSHVFSWRALAFIAVSLLPGIAYYHHAAEIHHLFGNTLGVISGGDAKWGNASIWLDPRFYLQLIAIERIWILGTAGSLLALLGLLGYRREGWRPLCYSWAIFILLYYLIVARYSGSEARGVHYHLYAVPLVALLAGGGLAALVQRATGTIVSKAVTVLPLFLIVMLVREDIDLLHHQQSIHWQEAGRAVARLARHDDRILVLSIDPAFEEGVPNNYQQPEVFFHARRRGCVLARDQQTGPKLQRVLGCGASWFVNFPEYNAQATPSFHLELARRMTKVFSGDKFEIYAIQQR